MLNILISWFACVFMLNTCCGCSACTTLWTFILGKAVLQSFLDANCGGSQDSQHVCPVSERPVRAALRYSPLSFH